MWNRIVKGLTVAVLGLTAACGDDGTGPSPDELVGTWRATKAEFVSVANPALKIDLVALGATVTVVLNSTKAYTVTIAIPGEPVETTAGVWSASNDVLTLTESATSVMQFDMTLSGTTLTLTGADVDFDLDGDDQDDPAKLTLVMVKQ